MSRFTAIALLTLLLAVFAAPVRAQQIAIPDFGRRGDLPEGLTATFSAQLRQEVLRTGLGVDSAGLVTEGIAGSLDPFYTTLAGRLLGTRYALSGEIVDTPGSESRFTVNVLIVDTLDERHSDVISRSLHLQDMVAVARELAHEIVAFTDLTQTLPTGDSGLFISSEPSGATIYINGLMVGRTGELNLLELAPGRYSIELRLDGYLPATRVEELRSGGTNFPHFRLSELRGGSAQVESQPVAEVFFAGESLGFTPLTVALPAGSQTLVLTREGFRDLEVQVEVRHNRVTRLDVDLDAVREPLVFWEPADSVRVAVDGVLQTGSAALELRPGRVTFTIWRAGTSQDYTMVLPLTGVFRLDTDLGALVPLRR